MAKDSLSEDIIVPVVVQQRRQQTGEHVIVQLDVVLAGPSLHLFEFISSVGARPGAWRQSSSLHCFPFSIAVKVLVSTCGSEISPEVALY